MVQRDGVYWIIAGAYNSANRFELYRWDGQSAPNLAHQWQKGTFNPEAILAVPNRPGEFLILSDEGAVKRGAAQCKELPETQRQFRSILARVTGTEN
jgi:hypothetical protein